MVIACFSPPITLNTETLSRGIPLDLQALTKDGITVEEPWF